jgi:hypothetical protein
MRSVGDLFRRWRLAPFLALGAALIWLGPRPSHAGAFLQKPDEGVLIVTGTFTDSVRAYDRAGHLVPVAHWRKFAPLGSKLTWDRMVN